MHYIKLGLWIFILSVLYADGIFEFFGFYPELLLLFSVLYSVWAKSFKERVTVSVVSGIFMAALGGGGFLFSLLLVLYATLIFSWLFSEKKRVILMILVVFIMTVLYNGIFFKTAVFNALANSIFAFVLYPLIKRSFEEKERYIF